MKTVAVIVQEGFAPFEFGLACEAFGLDRTDDGIPRVRLPDRHARARPGTQQPRVLASTSTPISPSRTRRTSSWSRPIPRATWGSVDPRVTDVIRRAVERDAWVLSVCSGAFVVAASGVLDGRRATTHWMYADTMAAMYPLIEVDPDVLYVQDGRIITSAGTAAGLDACLHLLRQELGAGADQPHRAAHGRAAAARRRSGAVHRQAAAPGGLALARAGDGLDGARTCATTSPSTSSRRRRTCRRARSPVASRPTSARRRPPGSRGSGSSMPSDCSSGPTWASTASPRRAASARRRCCGRTSRGCWARPRPRTAPPSAATSTRSPPRPCSSRRSRSRGPRGACLPPSARGGGECTGCSRFPSRALAVGRALAGARRRGDAGAGPERGGDHCLTKRALLNLSQHGSSLTAAETSGET